MKRNITFTFSYTYMPCFLKTSVIILQVTTDLPLDLVSSSSPLEVRRLMTRLHALIRAKVMLI